MDKTDMVRGHEHLIVANAALEQLRHAIHMARGAHGVPIPADTTIYVARIAEWIGEHKEALKKELGLAETHDQYGNPLDK